MGFRLAEDYRFYVLCFDMEVASKFRLRFSLELYLCLNSLTLFIIFYWILFTNYNPSIHQLHAILNCLTSILIFLLHSSISFAHLLMLLLWLSKRLFDVLLGWNILLFLFALFFLFFLYLLPDLICCQSFPLFTNFLFLFFVFFWFRIRT